jgi:fermentation-respiration switch protein FrsA (DUF1100 family)
VSRSGAGSFPIGGPVALRSSRIISPGSSWLDLRDYDPGAVAAALDKPMFILQGGRDYHVIVADVAGLLTAERWPTADRSSPAPRLHQPENERSEDQLHR